LLQLTDILSQLPNILIYIVKYFEMIDQHIDSIEHDLGILLNLELV